MKDQFILVEFSPNVKIGGITKNKKIIMYKMILYKLLMLFILLILVYYIIVEKEDFVYILISIIIVIAVLSIIGAIYTAFKPKIDFYITGLDSGFSLSDLSLLWNVAQICNLEQATALFWSMPALTKCMTQISNKASENSSENNPKIQTLISKLFDYRTKLQNQTDDKKGLESSMALDKGQKLRIILPGSGVYTSKILNNGKEIIISVPRQKDMIPIPANEWVGKSLNVYLWRKGDARYVFDTIVTSAGIFIGESSISLKHSNNLIRTQKRKAVRAKCNIDASLYIIKSEKIDYNAVETQRGYKCHIEDISESGALIRIGGKGVSNVQLKIQFTIQNMLIIMFGIVRTVEYNEKLNQSLLHFECIHIEPAMKNEILRYVYNMLPEREKEIYDALSLTESDEASESGANQKNQEEKLNKEAEISKEENNAENNSMNNVTISNKKVLTKEDIAVENEISVKDDLQNIEDPLTKSEDPIDDSFTLFDDYK